MWTKARELKGTTAAWPGPLRAGGPPKGRQPQGRATAAWRQPQGRAASSLPRKAKVETKISSQEGGGSRVIWANTLLLCICSVSPGEAHGCFVLALSCRGVSASFSVYFLEDVASYKNSGREYSWQSQP